MRDVARAVVPVQCPGCGTLDVRWCDECAAVWWEEPVRTESGAGRLDIVGQVPLPVWSLAPLTGRAHGMVSAWKDAGRRDLDDFFCQAIARGATAVLAPSVGCFDRCVTVVGAPARPHHTRRRGVDLPRMLAAATADALRRQGIDACAVSALTVGAGEARAQSARGRWRGARAEVRVVVPVARDSPVVLVDDVMTTGATLASCCAALESVGATSVAGLTLAATEVLSNPPRLGLG